MSSTHLVATVSDTDFRLIAESMAHIVWMTAPDGATGFLNLEGVSYLGPPATANPAWDWVALVHPDEIEAARRAWNFCQSDEHAALHDSLTGLPNRALLNDRLLHGLAGSHRRGAQLGVMFLDVDQFKILNDSLGHGAGDAFLRLAADRIAGAIRPGDTVARIGGDEFVIVCDDVSALETERIGGRVLEALSSPCHIASHELRITASLGIAISTTDATPESLLRDSDAAMYRAKERGGGRIELFDDALRYIAKRRFATASALHRALERDEFTVQYQPVIDLSTGLMVSVEALLRWEHPDHGRIAPADFISVAEETGLIVPIGARVLEQACQDLAGWQRDGGNPATTLSVAVNMSVPQLRSPNIAVFIENVLHRTREWRPKDSCRA